MLRCKNIMYGQIYFIGFLMIFLSCSSHKNSSEDSKSNYSNSTDSLNKEEYTLHLNFTSFDTTIEVVFVNTKKDINACQQQTFDNLKVWQNNIVPELINKIFNYYKKSYPDYKKGWTLDNRLTQEEIEKNLPTPSDPLTLKNYYKPAAIYIPSKEKCESGTFGIYFECTWDIENSLGIAVKNWKIVEVSNGDIAF